MKAVLFTLAVAVLLLSCAQGWQLNEAQRQRHELCASISNQAEFSEKTLHRAKRNTPKLTYYKNHPAELKALLADINAQIIKFAPRPCGG
jgi:hypothetical protein